MNCILCERIMNVDETGEPFMIFKGKWICSACYRSIIPMIYEMAGYGDGGIIHLIFKDLLSSKHNRKHKPTIRNYRKILKLLLHKYNFRCVHCGKTEDLTVDHKIPVSKGGNDEIGNLQILCKPCNSRKGCKLE